MTSEKILETINQIESFLNRFDIPTIKADHDCRYMGPYDRLAHCAYMIGEMRIMIQEGRIEKCMRWLGFIQGVLWTLGHFSIEQLKQQNMPDESDKLQGSLF